MGAPGWGRRHTRQTMANKANTAWVLVAATAAALAIGVALWLSGGANPDSQAAMPAAKRQVKKEAATGLFQKLTFWKWVL